MSKSSHSPQFKSVTASWDRKSSVRSKPRRFITEEEAHLNLFSISLTPVASHPEVVERGKAAVRRILAYRLYDYLDFTAALELHTVNPVVLQLSQHGFGFELPPSMQFDAFRIYCDEAYHSLFSVDIKRQAIQASGIASLPHTEIPFARAIERTRACVPARISGLVDLCAAVVSETLISGTLTAAPGDSTIVRAVREMLEDHAADERVHHAYFTRAFEEIWPKIDFKARESLSPYFADLILAFLRPDMAGEARMLRVVGIAKEDAERIVHETHSHPDSTNSVRCAARSTIRLLERMGVLEYTHVKEYFAERHLL